jgi:hypothetical protein
MAAGDIKQVFGTSTGITITLASLASSATAGRESAAVDNSSNLYVDALVTVTIDLAAGAPANDQAVYVYAAASEDGTTYTDNATGSDAAITLRTPTNLRVIGIINTPVDGAVYTQVMSVAQAFGGILPRKWSIVVRNYSGQAFHSSGNSASYTGVYANVAAA